ncbi:MAG: IS110 family transposase [Balneola sp.]
MNYSYYLGIDISKNHLDLSLIDSSNFRQDYHCLNTAEAVSETLLQISSTHNKLLLCAEFTGMYGFNLIQAALSLKLSLWMENPAQIKYSSGIQRGKNDPVDAWRIACYSLRFCDRAQLMRVQHETIEQLAYLDSERTLLVADRGKYKAQLSDQQGYMPAHIWQEKAHRLQQLIQSFEQHITAIEQRMLSLIDDDEMLARQMELLQSIPGVGPRLGCYMVIATQGFCRFKNAKAICCHAGIAPFAHHSGDNTHTRARVSHYADKRLKMLLHLAALSVIQHPGELKTYYQRKCEEGKSKMSVINAVRSKLVHRMFAVVMRGEKYVPDY